MFDTMTFTKAFGALCGALLVFLLGAWAADEIFKGTQYKEQAFVIEVEGATTAEPEPEVDFATLFAAADAGAGERLFRQCSACHKLEPGANGTGPYLHGIVGREIGVAEGYAQYSGALSEVAEVWTPENLNGFLEAPRSWAPGTSMGYNGMRKPEDRANLIAYLATYE
ncbi:MAG: cytochrome c family protein [Pseudomonadota bacterium]